MRGDIVIAFRNNIEMFVILSELSESKDLRIPGLLSSG